MRSLEQRRSAMEQRLSDPAVYGGPTRDLMDLQLKLGEVKKKLAAAEERWLAAQSALNRARPKPRRRAGNRTQALAFSSQAPLSFCWK